MTDYIPYLSRQDVKDLQHNVEKNIELYCDRSASFEGVEGIKRKKSNARFESALALDSYAPADDKKNALKVYKSLRNLSPQQASDERVWACLTHFEAKAYVYHRWIEHAADPVHTVRMHCFVSGGRSSTVGLLRDNALSRLWWLGYYAYQIVPDAPAEFLEVVLPSDFWREVIYSPTVSRNLKILKAIYECLRESSERQDGLLKKSTYRKWFKYLNLAGGVLLLDSLSPENLKEVVDRSAAKALRDQASESVSGSGGV